MIKTSKKKINDFFENASKSIDICEERRNLLNKIAKKITSVYLKNKKVNINFICTHNSRRSQLGQVWAFFAKNYFKLKKINAFSGGTEVTSFHRNTVKTLQEVGFIFNMIDFSHQNPKYDISFNGSKKSIQGFSKIYDNKINNTPFIAITTCNSADKKCPYISEASFRFHLPFVDPKVSDGTKEQEETYLATNKQIAGEIFYIFKQIKKALN